MSSPLWLEELKVGDIDCLSLPNLDVTTQPRSPSGNDVAFPDAFAVLEIPSIKNGISIKLKNEYKDFIKFINIYDEAGNIHSFYYDAEFDADGSLFIAGNIPYGSGIFIDMIFTEDPENFESNYKTYFLSVFLEESGPVEGDEWDGGRTFVIIRDNSTKNEIARAYDLMNTKIYEEINNKYTLDFNILPYENVWQIMHPNFLEINGDYFRVRRVEKRRTNTLMMTINCEHISYELNVQYELDAANEDISLPEEYTFEGTPIEILQELLGDTRFSIDQVDFTSPVTFITKPMGVRSMVLQLANQIGAEVYWNKFKVSLLQRRGSDRNLKLEVGKNLLSMTEVYDTQTNGSLVRSYDVDIIDMSIVDQAAELYNIQLGDTINLIDDQFDIDVYRRIVSYEIDPFRKELPKVQLGRASKNITSSLNDVQISVGQGGGSGGSNNVALALINKYTTTFEMIDESSGSSPEDYPMLMFEHPNFYTNVLATSNTPIFAAVKIIGDASEDMDLQGSLFIRVIDDGGGTISMALNSYRFDPIPSSQFKTRVSQGFNTISVPCVIDLEPGQYVEVYLIVATSIGTFTCSAYESNLCLHGNNLSIEEDISIS